MHIYRTYVLTKDNNGVYKHKLVAASTLTKLKKIIVTYERLLAERHKLEEMEKAFDEADVFSAIRIDK